MIFVYNPYKLRKQVKQNNDNCYLKGGFLSGALAKKIIFVDDQLLKCFLLFPMANKQKYAETPLMKQYYNIKAKHPDAILLFRVGDFYETFGADAIKTSEILGITLTRRANGAASSVELAGFPIMPSTSIFQGWSGQGRGWRYANSLRILNWQRK